MKPQAIAGKVAVAQSVGANRFPGTHTRRFWADASSPGEVVRLETWGRTDGHFEPSGLSSVRCYGSTAFRSLPQRSSTRALPWPRSCAPAPSPRTAGAPVWARHLEILRLRLEQAGRELTDAGNTSEAATSDPCAVSAATTGAANASRLDD